MLFRSPEGSLFAAKKISMLGYTSTAPLFIRTNLSLESVYLRMGGNWSGGDFNLRVGSAAALAELALRSADVQNIEGGDVKLTGSIGWAMLNLDNLTPHDGTNATRVTRRNEVRQRINDLKLQTGIEAVQPSNWVLGDPTMNMIIRSTTTGAASFVDVNPVTATFRTTTLSGATNPLYYIAGMNFSENTVTLTGSVPVDLASDMIGDIRTKWGTMRLYPGSSLIFSNNDITLIKQTQATPGSNPLGSAASGGINGIGGIVKFDAVAGAVTLQEAGIRSDGVLNVGQHRLSVRSDQTWGNAESGLGFIRMRAYHNQALIEAADLLPLNNLDEIPLVLECDTPAGVVAFLPGGEFRGIRIVGSQSSGRWTYFSMTGDLTLKGAAIAPGRSEERRVW